MSVHLSAAGAHGGEGLVAGGIEEGNYPAVDGDGIRADMLGNAARFAGSHVGNDGCSPAARSCRGQRGP